MARMARSGSSRKFANWSILLQYSNLALCQNFVGNTAVVPMNKVAGTSVNEMEICDVSAAVSAKLCVALGRAFVVYCLGVELCFTLFANPMGRVRQYEQKRISE